MANALAHRGVTPNAISLFSIAQAGLLSLLICVVGFFGGLVASAIKRDAGVKDYGQLIEKATAA